MATEHQGACCLGDNWFDVSVGGRRWHVRVGEGLECEDGSPALGLTHFEQRAIELDASLFEWPGILDLDRVWAHEFLHALIDRERRFPDESPFGGRTSRWQREEALVGALDDDLSLNLKFPWEMT